jgi:acetyl esterase/lipase
MALRTEATLLDKLLLLPLLAKTLTVVFFRAIFTPLNSGPKANGTLKDIVFAALRSHLGSINAAQEYWLKSIMPGTDQSYLDFTSKQKLDPETTHLESGAKLHWLGPKTAQRVMLFFHGGGYVMACSPGHWQWLFDLQNDVSKDIAIAVLSYDLAPDAQYPTQLKQAAEALHWLLEKQGRNPREVCIEQQGHLQLSR